MGRKVHPRAFRLGVSQGWDAAWFSKKNFRSFLREDVQIREYLLKSLKEALVDRVEFERTRQKMTIIIHAAKPGIIIGRGGAGIEELKKTIVSKFYPGKKVAIHINVKEVKNPSLSARIVGLQIVADIERRLPYRRSMKQSIQRVMREKASGVKIRVGGRLNGADIARKETLSEGSIPLHTLRSDIDFARITARTIYGAIGVKVWINRGEVFQKTEQK